MIKAFRKNEPAIVVGVLATAALAAQDAVANGHLSWRDIVGIVVAAVIRKYVTPADEHSAP